MNKSSGSIYIMTMIFGLILLSGSMLVLRLQVTENLRTANWKLRFSGHNQVKTALNLWLKLSDKERAQMYKNPFELGQGICQVSKIRESSNKRTLKIVSEQKYPVAKTIYTVQLIKKNSKWNIEQAEVNYE